MVNYVLSFCKITAASRLFSRNFYLPLLKPLTPKEALRTYRITGKWLLGSKIQHYIPVLLKHSKKRPKNVKDYGCKVHEEMEDFNYMTPVIDPDNEKQKVLAEILETKQGQGVFIYTVEDKKYNIVLQAQFELAIRDRDIIDILVSQTNDKIIVKLKDLKKIPMEIQYYEGTDEFYCGEGSTTPKDEEFHHHGKYTMSLAKIFEDKERFEEEWEEQLRRLIKRKKKQKGEGSKAWKEMMKENMKNFDWQKFEEDAKKVIDEISQPAVEEDIEMDIDDLEKTKNVSEILSNADNLTKLPTLIEIPEIIKSMDKATLCEISDEEDPPPDEAVNKRRVSGVKVTLPSGKECFVSGQMVHTDNGDVFVPGQTIESEFGTEYAPGITININNKPTLISGLIMGEEEKPPMFLPTQSTITADGQLTFASTPEERPKPEPEVIKKREEKRTARKKALEPLTPPPSSIETAEFEVEIDESDEKSVDDSSIELSLEEELDFEAIRLKHEQQRLELERLKQILHDDGMDELIANLEDKKAQLKLKLEELRRLSISHGDSLITYASDNDALEIASKISDNKDTINRLSEILLTLTRRASTFPDKNNINADNINRHTSSPALENQSETNDKFNNCSDKLKMLLKTAVVAANECYKNRPKDQVLALNVLSEIISNVLIKDNRTLEELLGIMTTAMERQEMCTVIFKQLTQSKDTSLLGVLQEIISQNISEYDIQHNLIKILEKECKNLSEAFGKIIKLNPKMLRDLRNTIKQKSSKLNDATASQILHQTIIEIVQEAIDEDLGDLFQGSTDQIKEFLHEAASFAQALSLYNIQEDLSSSTPIKLEYIDTTTKDFLKRMILIRKLSERDYSLKSAITRIKRDPERAKSDPRIRQLIRESAVLIPQSTTTMRTSRDIPLPVMKRLNLLELEDLITQRCRIEFPVLISRGDLEAVIPKECARSVYNGRVPYVIIDETGINSIKPVNLLTGKGGLEKRYEPSFIKERSKEPEDDRSYFKARNSVRKLKKMYGGNSIYDNSHRSVA